LLEAKRVIGVFHVRVNRVNTFDDGDAAHTNAPGGRGNDDYGAAGANPVRLAVVRRGFERIASGRETEIADEDHIAAPQRLQTINRPFERIILTEFLNDLPLDVFQQSQHCEMRAVNLLFLIGD
jgi:hypothetical protein